MLVIRLFRTGKKNQPFFRVVVTDKRKPPRAGRFVEIVGFWNPLTKEKNLKVERIKYWLSKGAQPSDTVSNLLVSEKIIERPKIPKHKKAKKEKKKEILKEKEAPKEIPKEAPEEKETPKEEPKKEVPKKAPKKEKTPKEEPKELPKEEASKEKETPKEKPKEESKKELKEEKKEEKDEKGVKETTK